MKVVDNIHRCYKILKNWHNNYDEDVYYINLGLTDEQRNWWGDKSFKCNHCKDSGIVHIIGGATGLCPYCQDEII